MILFVDTEHQSGYEKPHGQWLMAARTRIKYRLEDVTGDEVYLVRYNLLTDRLLGRLSIRAIFFSGSSSTPADFGQGGQDAMFEVIREAAVPMFGFCGGMQVIGAAFGVPPGEIGTIPDGEEDPNPEQNPGMQKEYGYFAMPLTGSHPVLEGLGPAPIMRNAHSWELKAVPEGFRVLAATSITPIQMIVNEQRRVVGTQFHPEYWTEEHPAGKRMIQNFCAWAGLATASGQPEPPQNP